MALIDGGQLDPIRRSNEEREILHGRKGALGYSPLEGAVERSPVTEQISHGETGSIPYQPLERSSFSLPPLGGAGGAGSETEPNVDWSKIAPAGAIGTSTRFPGDRGAGAVLQMGALEVVSGLAAFAEAMSGGRIGADSRRALEGQIADVFQSMRPEVQAALSREFTDLGPEGVLQNPSSYGYQMLKQIPILASLLVPAGGGAAIGARVAGGAAVKRGASALAVQEARRRGVVTGATIAGPAGEGTVVGGMTAGQIMSGIENAPDEVLMGSPVYKRLREQGADEATAKRELMNELGRREALTVGAGSVLLNIIPSAVFGRIMAGVAKRPWAEAMVAQPVTEMLQEPFEGYREDVAAQQSYDPSRVPGADTFERAVAGGALGLGMGAATVGAGYAGRRILGIDKIDEGDTTGQQLGDPGIAEAIPTPPPPPPPQGEFDFQGSRVPGLGQGATDLPPGGPVGPGPADVGPPASGFPPAPPGEYTTRRGEQRPIPEEPTPEQQAEADIAARQGSARLDQLEYELDREGLLDPMTGEPTKKVSEQSKEEKARIAELKKLRAANPDIAGQAQLDRLERRAEEDWFDETGKPRKGLKGSALKAAKQLAALRAKYTPQTEMNLPQGKATDATRRKIMRDAEQKALPAPPPSESDVDVILEEDSQRELEAQLAILQEQENLSPAERRRAKDIGKRLGIIYEAQRQRDIRAGGPATVIESGPTIEMSGPTGTLETTGPRRNVQSRRQLKLERVAPKDAEAKLARLSQQISEGRAEGRNVDHLIQQRKGIQRRLESLRGAPAAETQLETLREQVAEAESAVTELESRPDPVYGRTAKKAGQVNPKAKAQLVAARAAARAKARRLRVELEQATAPEVEERDTKTKDMFGQRTPEKEAGQKFKRKGTTLPEAKALLQDSIRSSMLEMMTALGLGETGVYSNAVSRSLLRVRGELARRIKRAKSKEDLLRALHDVAHSEGNTTIGDSRVTVLALADRVYRNLTGEKLPAEGAFAQPDTVEQLLEVATEGRPMGRVTGAVIEGADPTEAETITAAEEEVTPDQLVQQAIAVSEAASADISAAALGVTEAELDDMGRLDEATSDNLDAVEDIDMSPTSSDIQFSKNEEAFAKYVASEETADPYAVSLPPTDAASPLQRLADRAAQSLLDVFGVRETKRLLRQSLALFSENGLFASQPKAREVLTRWRGNVMLYAIQEGDSDLQTAVGLMSEAASPELQAAWFLRTLTSLSGDVKLEVSLREMLAGRDTDLLRMLGELSEQVRQLTAYDQLGEKITRFGVLTTKTDAELLAMKRNDLRKYISSRLGVPMPRKGVKETGYTMQDMVNALRTREALMRDAFEIFVQSDVRLKVSGAQWLSIIREGLGDTRITNEQLDQVLSAFQTARKQEGAGDAVTVLREVLTGELFPTDPKQLAKRDGISLREAQKISRLNHQRVYQMMNRVSDRFNRFMRDQLAVAEKVGEHVYAPPDKVAEQVAAEIEQERQARTDTARREGAARGRLTQALQRERENLQNPAYQEALEQRLKGNKERLRIVYGRHGLPVPGEPNLPAAIAVEGGAELAEARAAEGVRLYGAINAGETSLEQRTDNLPTDMYSRLGDPDVAAVYIDDQIRRIGEQDPEASSAAVLKKLRAVLEVPAKSAAENRSTGRLTDAQFVKLLEGLGFTKSYTDVKLGENFDRHFAVNQILNSINAFGQPVFTGGRFLSEYLRPMLSLGEPKSAVTSALGKAHENIVRAIARYLNNDNEVSGNKSQLIRFIMSSDRFQQMWSEGLRDRENISAMERAAKRQDKNWEPREEQTLASMSPAAKKAEIERLNEALAQYDRLLAAYATNPVVVEEVLQQRKVVTELLKLLKLKDPVRSVKRHLQSLHNERISSLEARIEEAVGRLGALQNELGTTAQRDVDWINQVTQLKLRDMSSTTLNRAAGQLRQLENVLQARRKEAVRAKNGKQIAAATEELARTRGLLKAIEAVDFYRSPPTRGKRKVSESKYQEAIALLRKYVGDVPEANTRTHFLQEMLADARKHLSGLQAQLQMAKTEAKAALASPTIMSVDEVLEQIAAVEARREQVTNDARLGLLVEAQEADLASDTASALNVAERDKRIAQLRERQAKVWPRVENSLASIAEWANGAQEASRRIVSEVVAVLHKNRDAKDMVTTSSMETVAPYSNEMVVGSKVVQWMFTAQNLKGKVGRNSFLLPPVIRGSVQQVLDRVANDPRYNTRIKFNGKAYKLNEMTVSEFNTLRDEVRAAYISNRTAATRKQLDTLNEFANLDAEIRYAYAQAYNLIGDIHVSRRVTQSQAALKRTRKMTEEEVAAENAKLLGTLPTAKAAVETSRANPATMTQQQRRAAQEQEREAAQNAAEEFTGGVEGWVDQSPEAELAQIEAAINSGVVLPQFYTETDGKRIPSMGRQRRRMNQLREFIEQDVAQAMAATQERKKHMDLPLEQAADFIAGSAFIADSLTDRSKPASTKEIINALIESEAVDDMPAVTRFMLIAAQRLGLDIPVRWVSSDPVGGKTFLGRFVFDKNNPARGREILLNRKVFDALLDKERELDPELGHWNVQGRLAHAFMHELAHAMTHLKLVSDPNVQREFGTLMGIARQVMGKDHYGLTDVFEFAAEYFSNEAFQRDLHTVRINQDGTSISLWQRITNLVRAILGMPLPTTSMFEYMMDRSSALFMSPQMAQQFAETGAPHQLAQGYLNYEITMDGPGAAMANAAELAAEQASRRRWSLAAESGIRKVKLGFMTLDQIGESYAGLASKYTDLQNKKWAEVNRDMDSATRMMQDFSALGGDVADRLSTVMLKATNFNIHPDQPRGPNSMNAHLSNSPETARIYNDLKAEYDALPDEAKAVYAAVRQRHAEDYATTTRYVTSNIMAAFDFDVDNLPANWYEKLQETDSPAARHEYLSDLWDKYGLPDEKTGKKSEKGFTEAESDALARLARRPKLMNGPYFPMKRFGKYVVRARAKRRFTFTSEAEMGKVLGAIKDREPGARFEGFEGDSLSGTVSFQLTEMYDNLSEAHKRNAELFNQPVVDMTGTAFEFKGEALTWDEIPGVAEKNQMNMQELAGNYSSSFLRRMQEKLSNNPAALAAAKEAYLQMLPDTSMRKLELRRGYVQGASRDMVRSFAAVTKAAAYGNAQVKYGRLLSKEMEEMRNRSKNDYAQQAVVRELQKRDMNTANFMQETFLGATMDRLTEGGFVWFLGSPSYWMVNATQPYLLTLPYLSARYGTAQSYAALARARKLVFPTLAGKAARSGLGLKALRRDPKAHREFMRDIFGGLDDLFQGVKDPNMRAMLQEVEQMGLIDLTIAKDLNQTIQQTGDGAVAKRWESIVDTTRVMPHLVEVLNRSMTALAAYDLATRKGMGHEQATAVAVDTIRKTQFNYSAVNKARFMSRSTSELLRPVMLFQQYAQHVYYLMLRSAIDGFSAAKTPQERKEARKTFFRILGAHTIAAGTLGGMFEPFRVAAGIAFAVGQMVGMFDDEDDFESWWQRGANQAFGDMGGQIFSKGLPYGALGLDLHGRLGLNNLVSMSDPRVKGMEGSEWLMHKLFGLLGPLGSTAAAMADIPQKMRRGDFTGAIASASPKALRDLMQTYRMQDVGVLDYTGNVIMGSEQIDGLSLAYKMVGFAPSPVSQMYSSRGAVKRAESKIKKKRTRLMERWRRADTPAAQRKVLDDMFEFNKNYPEFLIDGKARVQAKARKRENERQAAQQGGYFSSANPAQQRRAQRIGAF